MSDRQRVFFGIEPADEVRHALAAFLEESLDHRPLPGRAVAPRNWHVTLRFLGQTVADDLDRVLGLVASELADEPVFRLGFGGLGAFPRPERATVLWLAVDRGAEAVSGLAEMCEAAAQRVGFAPDERPFHPHLTLARIRPQQRVSELIEEIGVFPTTQRVDHVAVYGSDTGRGGAEYTILERLPFGEADARV